MKNADMPAMALTGDAYVDFAGYDESRNDSSYNPECQGITKREYFAARAPNPDYAFIENFVQENKDNEYLVCNDADLTPSGGVACMAAYAYTYADAMCAYGDEK